MFPPPKPGSQPISPVPPRTVPAMRPAMPGPGPVAPAAGVVAGPAPTPHLSPAMLQALIARFKPGGQGHNPHRHALAGALAAPQG